MKTRYLRNACAALSLALGSAAWAGASPQQPLHPAIATGLAIPNHIPAPRGALRPISGRYVLVDAASAQLFMIEDGRVEDSMKVIVGKPTAATPQLTSSLAYATVNPYWHVPADLTRTLTAPNVLKHGVSYLTDRGYEVLSGFGPNARVIDPTTVDWKAVAEGRESVHVRQRPGPANSMGQLKFSLTSGSDIYLHDTPKKELFAETQRNLSAGCIRLEDAHRLARWLLGDEPQPAADAPEQHIPLPRQVPIVITYLDPQAQMQLAGLQ